MKNRYGIRNLSYVMIMALLPLFSTAQAHDSMDKNKIPPFRIELTSGDSVTSKNLKRNTPVMIVYFDPTCEHCQAFTRDLLEKIKSFDQLQIVYVTYTPVSEIRKFENDFGLKKYPNFIAGTEGYSFIVQKFYGVQRFPFIALYDRKGTMIAYYRMPPPIDELIKQFERKG